MKQFAKLMLLTLGFGLLAALTGLIGPQPKRTNASAAAAVAVVNTPGVNANQSGPWNVGITGTPNVNVANSPTVNLALGTTVGISGTPDVNLSPGTTVNVGNTPAVTFSNTSTTPLFVDAEVAARNPISGECIAVFDGQGFGQCDIVFFPSQGTLVPTGFRLVIETVSMSAGVCPGTIVLGASLGRNSNPFRTFLFLFPRFASNNNILNFYNDVERVRLYGDSGTAVTFQVSSTSSNCGRADFAISGYLVAQ
jgi:hypothetical protein